MIREENHIFQGMGRDVHPINQKGDMLWDAHNIRITSREGNSLLSITNEKGNINTNIRVSGKCLGHCVIGKYLVLFTVSNPTSRTRIFTIYRIDEQETGLRTLILYRSQVVYDSEEDSYGLDLDFDLEHPIQALGIYETELIQKVYWIDGKNQPRMINIAKPELLIPDEEEQKKYLIDGMQLSPVVYRGEDTLLSSVVEELKNKFPNGLYYGTSFDFVRDVTIPENITVEKIYGSGEFTPGVIQYAITYYNKYEQESHIVYVTPLQYISFKERGQDKGSTVPNSFKIEITNPDTTFEYVRVYAIQRSSLDGQPQVRILTDIKNTDTVLTCYDTGTTGSSFDAGALFYLGGEPVIPKCMEQKDNTLFFGNLEYNKNKDWLELKKSIQTNVSTRLKSNTLWKDNVDGNILTLDQNEEGVYYSYTPAINITGFKSNEVYRCGVQFQYKDGSWSDPIHIQDTILNTSYPEVVTEDGMRRAVKWKTKSLTFDSSIISEFINSGYLAIRPCVVFPTMHDRNIICQGMLCPTVFELTRRASSSPYAMSSWFFRSPYKTDDQVTVDDIHKGSFIQFRHNHSLFTGNDRGAEIQTNIPNSEIENIYQILDTDNVDKYGSYFYVDENIVTMHSPDIEFNNNFANLNLEEMFDLVIIGKVDLAAIIGDIDITTSVPAASKLGSGFIHRQFGYTINDDSKYNNGITSGPFYNDAIILENGSIEADVEKNGAVYHMVYPWNRTGSLNNSPAPEGDEGTRTAVLQKKKISNLKFFNNFKLFGTPIQYNVYNPEFFSFDQVQLVKVWVNHLQHKVPYYGNIETALATDTEYDLYAAKTGIADAIVPIKNFTVGTVTEDDKTYNANSTSKDSVSMKYKSTPHLVFSLASENNSIIPLLPQYKSLEDENEKKSYYIPTWEQNLVKKEDQNGAVLKFLGGAPYITAFSKETNSDPLVTTFQLHFREEDKFKSAVPLSNREGYGFHKVEDIEDNKMRGVITYCKEHLIKYQSDVKQLHDLQSGTVLKIIEGPNNSYVYQDNGLITPNETGYISSPEYFQVSDLRWEEKLFTTTDNMGFTQQKHYTLLYGTLQKVKQPEDTNNEGGKKEFHFDRQFFDNSSMSNISPYMLIAELRRKNIEGEGNQKVLNRFGGDSEEALMANRWIPAGDVQKLERNKDATIVYKDGDTWYSRYDCLKTYAFTPEDENQLVEIGSFMCESRSNIDGRTDRNRGQLSNLDMSPINFNLMNDAYSQHNNFFQYSIYDDDLYKSQRFNNQITWSLEKHAGEDIDSWTGITSANTVDMDGTKGRIVAIQQFRDSLFCLQEKAFNQLMFNSRVQIPTSDGIPIEITNGYKMEGYKMLSDTIGCQDKWSVLTTPSGIYFIDYLTQSIYLYTGEGLPQSLSDSKGLRFWVRENSTQKEWVPALRSNNGIKLFYDNKNQDVYFIPGVSGKTEEGNDDLSREALCYSEQLQHFTSFLNYGGTVNMFNFNDSFYSIENSTDTRMRMWKNFEGPYNTIFGIKYPYSLSFISNDSGQSETHMLTKIFDNIELRTDLYENSSSPVNRFPFNKVQALNEYQDTQLRDIEVKKKFRVWRMNIPRASKVADIWNTGQDKNRHIYGRSRVRNPWTRITLENDSPGTDRMVLHDLTVKYSI